MLSVCFNCCIKLWEHQKRPSKNIKNQAFINQYHWKGTNFPSHKEDWKKFKSNNKSIALNILLVRYNTENIGLAYKSKHNFKSKNQVLLLMITDDKKWHYLVVKRLWSLLKGITSNYNEDFYGLNCFHSYRTKNKLKNMKKYAMIMIIVM